MGLGGAAAKTDNYLPVLNKISMLWPVVFKGYLAMIDQESETGGQKRYCQGKLNLQYRSSWNTFQTRLHHHQRERFASTAAYSAIWAVLKSSRLAPIYLQGPLLVARERGPPAQEMLPRSGVTQTVTTQQYIPTSHL
jgi:hypothetical protein